MRYKFTEEDRAKAARNRDLEAIPHVFKEGTQHASNYIKRLLMDYMGVVYECSECKINKWNGKNINLQLDHIDGNNYNNKIENLRLLCPNCHSQTETYCGKGNTGSHKVTDDEMIDAIKQSNNIRQTLMKVGLTPKGGNYTRVRELLEKNNLSFKRP